MSVAPMNAVAAAAGPADKPWLNSYPAGVPHAIDVGAIGTLADRINHSFKTYAPNGAFESFGKTLTYGELAPLSRAFASWLQSRGMKKGDRIALMMPNVMAYPITLFGALLAGCTVVNVNPLYTPRELSHQLRDSGARMIVVLENFAHVVEETLTDVRLDQVVIATAGDALGLKGMIVNLVARHIKKIVPPYAIAGAIPLKAALKKGAAKAYEPPELTGDDIAFLQYTGGTTGVSKGATLTHRNVSANITQTELWLGQALTDKDVMVTALPLYHIYALTCCCFFFMANGGKCLLIANPRDIPGFIKTLKWTRFTHFSGVNTLYNALANHPDIKSVDFSSLRFSSAGGMAMQSVVAKQWKALTGVPIIEGYGLSETSPVATTNRTDIADFSGTIGFPLPGTDLAIRDQEGKDVTPGEPGEICVRGPQVMTGYWNRPEDTAKAIMPDGFFRTGDIGVMNPDGSFKIVDRLKDMIIVSGFNVYPNEVEEVIANHPGVLEVAVVGAPDASSGEAVVAHVVKREATLTAEELRDYCRANLTGYKVPKQFVFRDVLPKTNVGKVLRRALRDEKAAA